MLVHILLFYSYICKNILKLSFMHIAKLNNILKLRCVVLFFMLLLVVHSACGQNNPYKINDKLYPLYLKAYKMKSEKAGVALSDTLYRNAVALGDKKAECLALTIPMLYAESKAKDVKEIEGPLKRLQDRSLQTGFVQYYYFGATTKVIFLLNSDRYLDAMDYIEQQLKFAKTHNHTYGIFTGYRMLGMVHMYRGENMQSIDNFKQAAEYCLKYLPSQDVSTCYRPICECYRMLGEHEKMYEYAEKALKTVKSASTKDVLLLSKAYAEYALGYDSRFRKTYDEIKKNVSGFNTKTMPSIGMVVEAFNDLLNGKGVEAIDKLPDKVHPEERYLAKIIYYQRKNDYKNAMLYMQKLYWYQNEENFKIFDKDIASLNVRYNQQQLLNEKQKAEYENTRLELANTQLTLQNSDLELNKMKSAEHLARVNADKNLLFFNNQKLVSKQLRDSLEKQRLKREAKEKEIRSHNFIMFSLIAAICVILLLSAIYIYYNRRFSKKLKKSNSTLKETVEELFVARDKAQQSDRMKTMFVQNMSHEIRTPLNAIVGFSQLLVSNGADFSDEDKREMAKNISDNSELLSTLVNDILDMTALESGKYVMKVDKCNVNDLCNLAVKTVMHRKAPGVELVYHSMLPDNFTVDTDTQRVQQVLINMLTNAEKNTTEGSITLTASRTEDGKNLVFSVADTGVGVPKDKMDEIFERFKKLDNFKQGSGLGLNICRMIAERLGGSINIDREYVGGARFLFSLPVDL